MNQTIQELFNRKSVRAYSGEPITDEEKKLILESALQAPSAGNMGLYHIIDVQDQDVKDQLAILCDHQPFISKASLVLVFLADYQKWYDMFKYYDLPVGKLEESDLILAIEDCMVAAQNSVVAAQSLGIGSCYIGDILENFEKTQALLNLPKYAVPIGMVVYGKPTEQQKNRTKPKRFELEDMVSVNAYHQKTIEETKDMFKKQANKSDEQLAQYIESFAKRKFFAEFRYEMNRSARAIIESWLK